MPAPTTPEPRRRHLSIVLSETDYQVLVRTAERDTRTPDQQATHFIRQALHHEVLMEHWSQVGREQDGADASLPC